jgi:hypothetical protein
MIVGATGPYAASPTPTKHRVISSRTNVCAIPVAPLAKAPQDHSRIATSSQRDMRSPSQPKTGETSMYETRNAVASHPIRVCETPK